MSTKFKYGDIVQDRDTDSTALKYRYRVIKAWRNGAIDLVSLAASPTEGFIRVDQEDYKLFKKRKKACKSKAKFKIGDKVIWTISAHDKYRGIINNTEDGTYDITAEDDMRYFCIKPGALTLVKPQKPLKAKETASASILAAPSTEEKLGNEEVLWPHGPTVKQQLERTDNSLRFARALNDAFCAACKMRGYADDPLIANLIGQNEGCE